MFILMLSQFGQPYQPIGFYANMSLAKVSEKVESLNSKIRQFNALQGKYEKSAFDFKSLELVKKAIARDTGIEKIDETMQFQIVEVKELF